MRNIKYLVTATLTGIVLTGCFTNPVSLSHEEITSQVNRNLQTIDSHEFQIKSTLTLDEAIARAIKYNFDYRLKMWESTISGTDFSITAMNMLPNMMVNAGYVERSNLSEILSPVTGLVSTAEDRIRRLTDLRFTWNILDFGVSYFESKQKANQYLISLERRRRMLQKLAKDTKVAFWQAYAAQKFLAKSHRISAQIRNAIYTSRRSQREGLISKEEAATYRRDLLEIYNRIIRLEFELSRAKPRLLALINAVHSNNVRLVMRSKDRRSIMRDLPKNIVDLEKMALYNRPELREELYKHRISIDEINKARVRLFPGIEANIGGNYDSNDFLVNNTWGQGGLSISWNLFRIYSNAKRGHLAIQQEKLARVRSLALSMAIITQTDIAKLTYQQTYRLLNTSKEILSNDREIYNSLSRQRKEKFTSKLNYIKAGASLLNSELRYYFTLSEMQAAAADLVESVGIDPIANMNDLSAPLSKVIRMVGDYKFPAKYPLLIRKNNDVVVKRYNLAAKTNTNNVKSNTNVAATTVTKWSNKLASSSSNKAISSSNSANIVQKNANNASTAQTNKNGNAYSNLHVKSSNSAVKSEDKS